MILTVYAEYTGRTEFVLWRENGIHSRCYCEPWDDAFIRALSQELFERVHNGVGRLVPFLAGCVGWSYHEENTEPGGN